MNIIASAAAGWPLVARAQQSSMPVVGFLHPATVETTPQIIEAFRQGLAETGYVEGRNVVIEYRFADGRNERLAALAADLASRRVAVIVAPGGDSSAFAAKAATGYRLVGLYTGRILKGEKPADLPVQQSTKFEFVIT